MYTLWWQIAPRVICPAASGESDTDTGGVLHADEFVLL